MSVFCFLKYSVQDVETSFVLLQSFSVPFHKYPGLNLQPSSVNLSYIIILELSRSDDY